MNIRDLSYVQAVAKHKHFGRAAQACHVSQPALSSQIKKLERELGVNIFERDNRSVRLTPVGENILSRVDEALYAVDQIRAAAQAARDPLSGTFRLGFIPTIAPYLVSHFVQQAREELPRAALEFQEDITDRLTESLLGGDLDAAILATPPESPKLDVIRLYDEPFWVIFPERHALHLQRKIRTQDLPVDELLLLTEGHCFRDQALDVCRLGEPLKFNTIRATSLTTLVNLVASGLGITLVPAMALNETIANMDGVKTEKLDDPKAYRRIYLTYRKTYPRQKLLDHIAAVICQNLPESVRLVT